jgi:hypothetical protein
MQELDPAVDPTGARFVAGRIAFEQDADAIAYVATDWSTVQRTTVELDPLLIERIRARRALKQLTLRVGIEQIAEARRVATRTGRKYQAVLRQWLAEGASAARADRLKK